MALADATDSPNTGGGSKHGTPGQKGSTSILDAAKAMAGTTSLSNPKDPPVYLGAGSPPPQMGGFSPGYWAGQIDKTGTVSEVSSQYYGWDNATKNQLITQLSLAGHNASGMSDAQLQSLWASYVGQAAAYYGVGKKLTPWDIMAKDRATRESAQPRTTSQTSTAYDLSTSEDAQVIFMNAAQSLLGRDPTKSEISQFQSKLNAYEKANPTVTTVQSNYLGQDLQSQTSTTKGGVKEGARGLMAMEDAKRDPEYGAYQAATNYMDLIMQM